MFVRLQGCNLSCGLSPEDLVRASRENWSQLEIEKHQSKDAKWTCDSAQVWLKGRGYTNEQFYDELYSKGYIDKLHKGAHLVYTGGCPLLQQEQISSFMRFLKKEHYHHPASSPIKPYTEVETNGTIAPIAVDNLINQYNISIKLSNSGMYEERRIKPDAINFFTKSSKSWFKFVVVDQQDADEVLQLVERFQLPHKRIILMPGSATREELIRNSQKVVELCKEHGFRYSSRIQLEVWDKRTGV